MATHTESHLANSNRLLCRAIGNLFDSASTDIAFRLATEENEVKTIDAHKNWLSAVSPVFKAMFDGNWREKDTVEIVDAKYEVFDEFVQYLYGNEVDINEGNIDALVYLARKYIIDELVSKCTEYIELHLSIDTVIHSLDLALTYDLDGSKEKCKEIISDNTEDVLKTDDFLTCHSDILKIILQLEKIACTEARIFDACIEWADRQCRDKNVESNAETLRGKLGECFELIRFKEMKNEERAERIKLHSGRLFTRDELYDLFVHFIDNNFTANERRRILPKLPISSVSPDNLFQFKFPNGKLKEFSGKAEHVIRFSTSKSMVFTKFVFSKVFVAKYTESTVSATLCNLIYEMKKNDEIIETFKLDIGGDLINLNRCESITEIEQIYELKVTICPKSDDHEAPFYVFEHELESQTLGDVDLHIIKDYGQQQNNIGAFISGLYFKKPKMSEILATH